jgi:hypothetical protein
MKRPSLALSALAGALALAACHDTTEPSPPPPGPPVTLVVVTSTVGTEIDPAGYTLTVTGPGGTQQRSVPTNDSLRLSEPPGTYSLALGGISQNCFEGANPQTFADEQNPQTVTLAEGPTAPPVRFDIICTSAGGSGTGTVVLDVTVIDPRGVAKRTVTLDGTRSLTVSGKGSYAFTSVPDGLHRVQVPGDTYGGPLICDLFGPFEPDTVRIVGGATVHVGLEYDCF